MNQVQAIQLADWLRSNRDMIERTAISELVELIHTDLGIRANPASVLRIAQSVGIGVSLGQSRPALNEDQILELATCIADLYQRLGETYPPQLSHLLGRRSIRSEETKEDATLIIR
ncbi:MAG: hypothetical protein AABP62_29570 [Planctomycetota bacterium]